MTSLRAQAEDVLPAMVLLEDAEHLVLMDHLVELAGMLTRGDAQQQAVEILLQAEEVELRGVGEHGTVVVVLIAVNLVVGGVEAPDATEKFHLRQGAALGEHLDGLFGGGLIAMDGQGCGDNLLHTAAQAPDVVEGHGVVELQVDKVAVGDGDVNPHAAVGVEVVGSLAEHEEEGAGVGALTAGGGHVEELHLLGAEDAVVHTLNLVVDTY